MKIERILFSCLSTIKDPCCRTGCLCSPHLNSFLKLYRYIFKFYVNQWFFSNQWLKVVVSFLAWTGASLSFCVKTGTTVQSFMKIFIQIRNLKMKRTLIVLQDLNPSPFMQVCFLFQRLWLTVSFNINLPLDVNRFPAEGKTNTRKTMFSYRFDYQFILWQWLLITFVDQTLWIPQYRRR